jgi:hypothetical protein
MNQRPRKGDPHRHTLSIFHPGERSLDDPTKMKGQAVGCLRRPHSVGDRVPLAA